MEILRTLPSGEMEYPVGSAITFNMPWILAMASEIKRIWKKHYPEKETLYLVCTGSSGAIIAGIISHLLHNEALEIRIHHVKKPGELAHSTRPICTCASDLVVVVDDFIRSGATMRRLKDHFDDSMDFFKEIHITCVTGRWNEGDLPFFCDFFVMSK